MMPKLPQKRILYTVMPDDYRYGHVTGYSKDDLIAFGRAVAESCAEKCEELGPELVRWWHVDYANAAAQECANAIRKAAEEVGATAAPAR